MTKRPKYGGRKQETPNVLTAKVREKFSLLLENNLDKIQADLDKLKPFERIRLLVDIAKMVLPKNIDLNSQSDFESIRIINLGSGNKPKENE